MSTIFLISFNELETRVKTVKYYFENSAEGRLI